MSSEIEPVQVDKEKVFSSFVMDSKVFRKICCATSGAGNVYTSGAHEFTLGA